MYMNSRTYNEIAVVLRWYKISYSQMWIGHSHEIVPFEYQENYYF